MNKVLESNQAPAKPAKRRLLLLSPFAPRLDARMGGPLVIAQMIMALGEAERISLLYLRGPGEPPLDDRVRAACEFAIETRRSDDRYRTTFLRRQASSALHTTRGIPTWAADWHEPAYGTALRSFAAAWEPEIIQAEFHLMGQYLPHLGPRRPPIVLNQHEPGAAAAADRRSSGLMPGLIIPLLELRAWRSYERWLVRQADAIVTFTGRDRKVMERLGANGRVVVIPPGAAIPMHAYNPLGIEPPAILFFGNYVHSPNVDAARRLARDIYPALHEEMCDLRLWLPGDHPPAALTQLASEQILVPGCVPDLEPYLDQASVVVVPVRIGGGIRVKVLQALAAGKAIVASGLAIAGLDVVPGKHVLCAESDEDFVREVSWLLRHPRERAALAARAREWAVSHLGWSRAAAQYSALYDRLLSEPGSWRMGQPVHE